MNKHRTKLLFFLGLIIASLIAIPTTFYLSTNQQTIKSKAKAATTLSFTPQSSADHPLSLQVGDKLPLSIALQPGTNQISLVSLEILYDNTSVSPAETAAFVADSSVFPNIIEGPIYTPGRIQVSLSVGDDLTQAITKPVTIGTLTLKALRSTTSPTKVSFGENTKVLSVGSTDESNENVLSTANPTFLLINQMVSNHLPLTMTPSPSFSSRTTGLFFAISLPGIGTTAVDSRNNPSPKHLTRNISYELFTQDHTRVLYASDTIGYDPETGLYKGTSSPLPATLQSGTYTLQVGIGGYLKKQYPLPIMIQKGTTTTLPIIQLTAGDIDNDNRLTALDYGILLDCYSRSSLPMTDPRSEYNSKACLSHESRANADLNDDGIIDNKDLMYYQSSRP